MIRRILVVVLLLQALTVVGAQAHALDPGYLDLQQMTGNTWRVYWRKPNVRGQPMEIDAALPESCTPRTGPEPTFDGRAWITTWIATCPDGIAGAEISIPGLPAQRTDVLVRLQRLELSPVTARLTPDAPAFRVPEKQTMLEVLASYGKLGIEHILSGWDHLLFVFALLVLIADFPRLVGAITAFTVAHSITLALAALGHLSIPGPPVEATIALSIIFLATEILKHHDGELRLSERYPWVVSFSFGLLHGLGFAGALKDIGLPEGEVPAALFAFNLGVETGQLLFVAAVLGLSWLIGRIGSGQVLLRRPALLPPLGYAIGGVSTFWFVQRIVAF